MCSQIFQDAIFAAIAAIGFAAISRPPRRVYIYCAIIAAAGHSLRFVLMNGTMSMQIIPATSIAAFVIGLLAVFLTKFARTPAETCLFPALLPMIPGMYAYRGFGGLVMCLLNTQPDTFIHYFYLFVYNSITCLTVLFCMVAGGTIPIFIFKKVSFQATR